MTSPDDVVASAPAPSTELVPFGARLVVPAKPYRRPWWDPRRWFGWTRSRWRRSVQLRTVAITVVLCALAELITGALLSARIADGLFQERLGQVQSEATRGLRSADSAFSAAAGGNCPAILTLVNDQLRTLRGDGVNVRRDVVLRLLPGAGQPCSAGGNTSELAAQAIPENLKQTVATGSSQDIYWRSVSLESEENKQVPGVVFAKKVQIPPGRDYAMYFVYDFKQVQETLSLIHGVLLLGGVLLLVVIGAIAWYVARRSLLPVGEAARTAEKLARGQLAERMHVVGEDEVARLGRSFNRMADSLAEQIVQLETLSQMQQRFVSDVSHELRTPLTTVRMAAEVLHDAKDDFDPINRRSTELLYDQVERFQVLLNDLLEISRFDAGAAQLDAGEWDLSPVVRRVVESALPVAENANTEIRLDLPPEPVLVEMDPRRVERVVRNLVLNAVEHGEAKPIVVRVAGDEHAAAVSVRDHGIGLDPLDVSRVFDRFWRKDPARARTTGGSGLGLSIAMQDARLHGGWLQAWGEPGKGSVFRLTLPRHVGSSLSASPLPLVQSDPTSPISAEAVEADEAEWFPRPDPGVQDAEIVDDSGPVPGTVPTHLPSSLTGSLPITPAPRQAGDADEGTSS